MLGPNGSGKSTLVRGLLGLNDHLGGEVRAVRRAARLLLATSPGWATSRSGTPSRPRSGRPSRRSSRSAGSPTTGGGARCVHSRRRRRADRPRLDVVGLADRADADVSTLSGGPAATRPHRPRPGLQPRRPAHGRTHGRRGHRQPAGAVDGPGPARGAWHDDGHRHPRARGPGRHRHAHRGRAGWAHRVRRHRGRVRLTLRASSADQPPPPRATRTT